MRTLWIPLVVLCLWVLPATAAAQATLTGVVRDGSGAVLPGVTVEASSPALIEKTKSATTDGSGQYRIIDLVPGTYAISFTLPGFNTVRREGLQISGTQTLTIPVDLKIGGIEETILVTGETPVVDVQNAKREVALDQGAIEELPATRSAGALLNVMPGITVGTDGLAASPTMTFFSARGGPAGEGRMAVNGMAVAAANGGGGVSSYVYDSVNAEEVAVSVSGGLGENDIGGPVMNIIPRAGGNQFRGSAFVNQSGDWSRGDNLDDRLRGLGLTQTPGIVMQYDASVSYGGPIKRDRLWFYGSVRQLDSQSAVEGITANANAFDASTWDWAGSPTEARLVKGRKMVVGRLTAQLGKHKISFNSEYQRRCEGSPIEVDTSDACRSRGDDWIGLGTTTQSPEATSTASNGYFDWPYYVNQGFWTNPVTNRILLEAGYTKFTYYPAFGYPAPDNSNALIPVTEQRLDPNAVNPRTGQRYAPNANYSYRGLASWGGAKGEPDTWRASASYVTGAHAMKIGYQGGRVTQFNITYTNPSQLAYRVNAGIPNAVSYRLPDWGVKNVTNTNAFFVQDSWTRGRLTVQGALRYDHATSFSPEDGNGTARATWTNATPITFPKTPGVDAFDDITPRVGVAYDVFGNGKTAVKFNWGHYLGAATNDSPYNANNPASTTRVVTSITNRSWTDNDGDKVVDCDLMNFAGQSPTTTGSVDTCGALSGNSLNFGKTGDNLTQIDPRVLKGWGARNGDHQWGLTLQQELLPRISAEVSYNHRSFYGENVTDNLAQGPDDYDSYVITAPLDSRLPHGGGYDIRIYTPKVSQVGVAARNLLIPEQYVAGGSAEREHYYDGLDVTVNARVRGSLRLQLGTSTGRDVENTCDTTRYDSPDRRGCNEVDPFQTTLRGSASYTVPKIDVLVSATFRSQPGTLLSASWAVPNSVIQGLLGRLPNGQQVNGTTTINLLRSANANADEYLYVDERRTQIDMRLAKIIRIGRTRHDIGLDLTNLLNTNYGTSYDTNYSYTAPNGGNWGNPTSVYTPRYVRVNYTVNF